MLASADKQGRLAYNGSYSEGLYHGYGVMYGDSGAQYQGHFRRCGGGAELVTSSWGLKLMFLSRGEMTGEGMWLDSDHREMIQGQFRNGTVSGGSGAN